MLARRLENPLDHSGQLGAFADRNREHAANSPVHLACLAILIILGALSSFSSREDNDVPAAAAGLEFTHTIEAPTFGGFDIGFSE